MMKHLLIVLLVISVACDLAAQDTSDILKKLEGAWYAKGKAFGMTADINMAWEPALQNKFMRINYRMDMQTSDGKTQVFEGTALYQPAGEKTYRATWFDSGGEMHPISATTDGMSLTSIWGTPATKLGKTIYALKENDSVEVIDYIQKKDGTWREFNRNVLMRKK
jgi:hypothetical protein